MISRVFAHSDLPCFGRFTAPGTEEVRARILHLARQKAVFECQLAIEVGSDLAVEIEFPDGSSISLRARVSASGERGLFLLLEHSSDASAGQFGTRLIVASEEFLAQETDRQREARSDLRDTILQSTRTMRSSDLAERRSEVRVVGMSTIAALIEEALAEALALSTLSVDAAARQRILEETEATFQEKLATLQAEKAGAEEQIRSLHGELERARAVLEEERAREIANDQFTVSAAGIEEIEQRLGRLIEQGLRSGTVDVVTEEAMRGIVARLLDDEREKIGERAREAQSDAIQLLERKVSRLAQTVEKSEKAREIAEYRAAALEAAGGGTGLRSVMEAGLHPDDPTREKKLTLLEEIVKENDAVRDHIRRSHAGEIEPTEVQGTSEGGGVKKIAVKRVKPPPLLRS